MSKEARYLVKNLQEDALADRKMAFLSGPRQVGKTTLSRELLKSLENYFTWDDMDFRRRWTRSPVEAVSGRGPGPLVLDEIHKDRKWKTRLKGLYDLKGEEIPLIVTGSARLDIYRKGSDSLMGRYIPYRVHPFTVAEASDVLPPDEILSRDRPRFRWSDLLSLGGFPEPLLAGSQLKAQRWSHLRKDRLVQEEIRDLRNISDLHSFRLLLELLPSKVGSLLSINSLREDVDKAYATIRDWVFLTDALYWGFFVRPYSKRIVRSLKAEPKFYLYDILQIPFAEKGRRLENLAALHLLKACHLWTDCGYGRFDLHFVRNKEKEEVDFLVVRDAKPWLLVECKSNSKDPSPHLRKFATALQVPHRFQLVDVPNFDRLFSESGIRILDYQRFFSGWV